MLSVYGDFDPTGVRHTVEVSYSSADGRSYADSFVLDFGAMKDLKLSPPKGTHSIAQELEGLRGDLHSLTLEIRGLVDRDAGHDG